MGNDSLEAAKTQTNSVQSGDPQGASPDAWLAQSMEIRKGLQRLDRKQWWMWSSAVMVILLLTIGIASFAFPSLMRLGEGTYSFFLSQAVRGLIGLVLIFSVYSIYQQHLINRIRGELADQWTRSPESKTSPRKSTNSRSSIRSPDCITAAPANSVSPKKSRARAATRARLP